MFFHELTIAQARVFLDDQTANPADILDGIYERIDAIDEKVSAYLTLTRERAYSSAHFAACRIHRGDIRPLTGIPFAIKDNMCTEGIATTCASKILEHFVPPYESTATSRLNDQCAILTGKTNMDEFAMGSSTENSGFHITRNPWNREFVPGGSSGGSAAAVAAGECIAALGSDTGGSIRQPASFCGVVGLKPTYGRVSRYGLVAYASSLDQIGPITKTVEDAAIVLSVIAGYDPLDSTSVKLPVPDYAALLEKDIRGLKVGIPKEYFIDGMDREVEDAVRKAIHQIETLGAIPVEVSLPHTPYAIATYYLIATSEASSNLARYDGVKYGFRAKADDLLEMYAKTRAEGFGQEVKRRIMLGTFALSSGYYDAYYGTAQKVRALIRNDFTDVFKHADVLLTPTSPTPAFRIGEKTTDPLTMYLTDIFTISVNLAGVPAVSVPCGFTSTGLPVGLQIIGPSWGEETILAVAHAYEQSTEWHLRRPSL